MLFVYCFGKGRRYAVKSNTQCGSGWTVRDFGGGLSSDAMTGSDVSRNHQLGIGLGPRLANCTRMLDNLDQNNENNLIKGTCKPRQASLPLPGCLAYKGNP